MLSWFSMILQPISYVEEDFLQLFIMQEQKEQVEEISIAMTTAALKASFVYPCPHIDLQSVGAQIVP